MQAKTQTHAHTYKFHLCQNILTRTSST